MSDLRGSVETQRKEDGLYPAKVRLELDTCLQFAFVDSFPPGPLRLAALNMATAHWDAVLQDVARGQLTVEQASALYRQAILYQVATPATAEGQMRLVHWLGDLPHN